MKSWILPIAFVAACSAQTQLPVMPSLGSYAGANDFVSELSGSPDPTYGGTSGYADEVIQFRPPAGYAVRILTVQGTVSSYAKGVVPVGGHAGMSWGLVTTNTVNSTRANLLNDNCLTYVKQSITAAKDADTTQYAFTVTNGLLPPDNKLISRNAVYTNTTGLPIHSEVAIYITYRFEAIQ